MVKDQATADRQGLNRISDPGKNHQVQATAEENVQQNHQDQNRAAVRDTETGTAVRNETDRVRKYV
jgi:hypothetical protein